MLIVGLDGFTKQVVVNTCFRISNYRFFKSLGVTTTNEKDIGYYVCIEINLSNSTTEIHILYSDNCLGGENCLPKEISYKTYYQAVRLFNITSRLKNYIEKPAI